MHLGPLLNGLKEHRKPVFTTVMLLLVVLAIFMALAVPMDEDSSWEDGLQSSAFWQAFPLTIPFLFLSVHRSWTCSQLGRSHAVEYLKGHIGEKRFADKLAGLPIHVRVNSPVTVLFGAPSLFYSCRRFWVRLRRSNAFDEPLSRSNIGRKILMYGGTPA